LDLGALTLGPFSLAAVLSTAWRSSRGAGLAEAEELAEAEAGAELDWADADELADEAGCGPELIVRFTSVPGSTGVPAAIPGSMTLPAATLSLENELTFPTSSLASVSLFSATFLVSPTTSGTFTLSGPAG
jgi:hypothetical protein